MENYLEGNLPIRLYFVVPDINNIFDDFCFQNYIATDGKKYKGWNASTNWILNDIEQYVLEIELDKKM